MKFTPKQEKAILKRVGEFYKVMNQPSDLDLDQVLLAASVCLEFGEDIVNIIRKENP
jgi:hypothetical protein